MRLVEPLPQPCSVVHHASSHRMGRSIPRLPPTRASCCGWPAAWRRRKPSIPSATSPLRSGTPVEKILSTFPAIDTAVDGIKICQDWKTSPSVMDRGDADPLRTSSRTSAASCIRATNITGTPATCRRRRSPLRTSARGWRRCSVPRNEVMPPFINIGQRLEGIGESEELKAFTTGGFFGSEFGPMNLPFPEQAAPVGAPAGRAWTRTASPTATGCFRKLVDRSPATRSIERLPAGVACCARWKTPTACSSSKEREAFDLIAGTEGELTRHTTPAASAAAACWRGGWSRTARASSK